MWWLTVGCERPDTATRSHATSSAVAIVDSIRRRIGSASAPNDLARRSASASLSTSARTEPQQATGSRDLWRGHAARLFGGRAA